MSKKYTPGPWTAKAGGRGLHNGPFVTDSQADLIALVSYDGAPYGDGNEATANARLIAAAPEMLALLDGLAQPWRNLAEDESVNGGDLVEWFFEYLTDIERVIKQATSAP